METEPRHSFEGGKYYLGQDKDIRALSERYGMSADQAREAIFLPLTWAKRLARDEDPDVVYADAAATVAELEAAHGQTEDWDITRVAAAQNMLLVDRVDEAIILLVEAGDARYAALHFIHFAATRQHIFGLDVIIDVMDRLNSELIARGFDERIVSGLYNELIVGRLSGGRFQVEYQKPADQHTEKYARQRYHRASWEEIDEVVARPGYWPATATDEDRVDIAARFAAHQHAVFHAAKVERKAVEELKAFIAEQEGEAEVWDRLRFTAAMSLYQAGEPRFGLGVIRSMDDPAMMGVASHALLAVGREDDAFEAAQIIPDGAVFARTLHGGEWQNRARIDKLLADMTVADKANVRRYDPDFRIGVAEGLQAVYAEAGDEETAIAMRKRADLLRKQKASKFIVAPKHR